VERGRGRYVAGPSASSSKSSSSFRSNISLSPTKQKVQKHSDFSEEYADSEVAIVLHNGQSIVGRIAEARRYWFKVVLNDRTILYINKAWIVYVSPKR